MIDKLPGIQIAGTSDRCTRPHDFCQNSTLVALNLALQGDYLVEIPSGGDGTLEVGGVAYQVSPSGAREEIGGPCAPDYYSSNSMSLRVLARDAEARAKRLPQADGPSCSLGNDLSASIGVSLYNVATGTPFEGTVVYTGLGQNGELLFSTPGFTSEFGSPLLGISVSGVELPLPKVDAELWASVPNYDAGVLREGKGGALILATAYAPSVPYDAAMLSKLEHVVGVKVHAEKNCAYVAGGGINEPETALWDVVFDTDPPVIAHASQRTPLRLDGHQYEVWVSGVGTGSFSIYRVD